MTITDDKIANPLNFYKIPDEVALDKTLTVEEKIKILTNWLNDIELRETAEAENMPSIHNSRGHHIEQIERLLRQYRAE
ncbi:MAG: hypothetical protein CK424_02485 [Legionella sp.]|nr:MAG: hypothetical protein CK424_02485 [Legionella sp.]